MCKETGSFFHITTTIQIFAQAMCRKIDTFVGFLLSGIAIVMAMISIFRRGSICGVMDLGSGTS
jgi:hypothetical protein